MLNQESWGSQNRLRLVFVVWEMITEYRVEAPSFAPNLEKYTATQVLTVLEDRNQENNKRNSSFFNSDFVP